MTKALLLIIFASKTIGLAKADTTPSQIICSFYSRTIDLDKEISVELVNDIRTDRVSDEPMGKFSVSLWAGVEGRGKVATAAELIVKNIETSKVVYKAHWKRPTYLTNHFKDHGFTGLNYLDEYSADGELQFICRVN